MHGLQITQREAKFPGSKFSEDFLWCFMSYLNDTRKVQNYNFEIMIDTSEGVGVMTEFALNIISNINRACLS